MAQYRGGFVGPQEETCRKTFTEMTGVPRDSCLVIIYGQQDLGKKFPLQDGVETRIGRGTDNHIVLDMNNVSRVHAIVEKKSEIGFIVRDNRSTNGTYVNDQEVKGERPLHNGDLIKVGGAVFKFLEGGDIEALFHEEIYRLTIVDGLTQVHNKRYLLEFLDREVARCGRYERPLSLLMFDIDHFKKVNDTYGHPAGDAVLRRLADLVSQHIRKEECFARYGGEEFSIVMPETKLQRTAIFAEKIRDMVERTAFLFEDQIIPVTVSIGIAEMKSHQDTMAFIAAADAQLYNAKMNGRNRVEGGNTP